MININLIWFFFKLWRNVFRNVRSERKFWMKKRERWKRRDWYVNILINFELCVFLFLIVKFKSEEYLIFIILLLKF